MNSAASADAAMLRARVVDALGEVREFRCNDPAASGAMRVLRLTALTLADFWLPALDQLTEPEDESRKCDEA
jgi:hypothetical protein